MKKINGFTLAEVLITLVIIGIIAAMTIPTLMNKTNEQETVVAVKKAYSILSQAYQRMVSDNGEINPSYFGSTPIESMENFAKAIVPYFSVTKYCDNVSDCFHPDSQYIDGDSFLDRWDGRPAFVLADGSIVVVYFSGLITEVGNSEVLKSVMGDLVVDVNGLKGPNVIGKDMFHFLITKYGILPSGGPDITHSSYAFDSCKTGGGFGCTAWVITKGNLDYLRKDVNW